MESVADRLGAGQSSALPSSERLSAKLRTGLREGARPSASEAVSIAAVVAALLLLTGLPGFFGYVSAPADRQFMGIVLNTPDTAQYFSWARESAKSLLIENKLTPEVAEPVFFNLFWLAAGRLAATFGIGLPEMLQWLRPFAGAAYLGAIYWFVALVARRPLERRISFLVLAFGGGLGWLFAVHKQFSGELQYPLDLYVTEPNTFLTVMAFPHQAMAGGLLVAIFCAATLAFERRSLPIAIGAGLLGLVLGLQHGYDLLIVYGVIGVVTLGLMLQDRSFIRPAILCGTIVGLSAPAALYVGYLGRESFMWKGVLAQYGNAEVYTPNPLHLLVLMGLPLLLVLGGFAIGLPRVRRLTFQRIQRASVRELILITWLIVGFFLLYIPTDFQIKMLAAWQVPVGVIATRVWLDHVAPLVARLRISPRLRSQAAVGALLVAAVLPVNLYLLSWRIVDLARHDYPYYLHRDEVAALGWLENNADPSDVVLSALTIGQYIPSMTGTRAFLAHWAQTLDFYTKRRLVRGFFDPAVSGDERINVLTHYGVRFVFYGDQERSLGSFDLERAPYLRLVYTSPRASIYEFQDERTAEARGT